MQSSGMVRWLPNQHHQTVIEHLTTGPQAQQHSIPSQPSLPPRPTSVTQATSRPLHPHIPSRHRLHLLRARNLRHPTDPMPMIQLDLGLRLLKRIRTVHNPQLDDHHARRPLALAEQRRATVAAEVARDLVAAVGRLGDGLGRAGDQLEVRFRDADVRAVDRARDFAAVEAVAEGLLRVEWGWCQW